MLFMELWLGYIHPLHKLTTHTQARTHHARTLICMAVFHSLSLFLPLSLLLQSSTAEGGLLKRAVGREHIPSVQNETSLIFLCPLSCCFSLSLSVPVLLLFSCLYLSFLFSISSFLSSPPHLYHILSFYSLFLLPSSCLLGLWTR